MARVYVKKTHCIRGHELTPENRSGGTGQCKLCKKIHFANHRKRDPDYKKRWRKKHRDRLRTEHIGYRYGISQEVYDCLLSEQNGKCALCGLVFDSSENLKTPRVDHDHVTGKVRALLCHHCNAGLGQFKDNPDVMERAAAYVRLHRTAVYTDVD